MNDKTVLHLPAIIFFHAEGGNDAADTAQYLLPLPDGKGGLFFEKLVCGQAEKVAGDIHLKDKRGGVVLLQAETLKV